jgi:hypothetical protein
VDEALLTCAKAVGLISVPKMLEGQMQQTITGTGWLVTPDLALTCWHVVQVRTHYDAPISEVDLIKQIENGLLIFDHTSPEKEVEYAFQQLEHYDQNLDYALLRLKDRANYLLRDRGFLALDTDPTLTAQTQLFVLQHPRGQLQQRAAGHYLKSAPDGTRIFYNTPTDSGASGSPVLSVPHWWAIALHTGENQSERLREGILVKAILANLAQHRPELHQEIIEAQRAKE